MPTVVIADDSPTLRRIVASVLERDGYQRRHRRGRRRGGPDASFRTQPDAVILDVQMPRRLRLRRCPAAQGRLADRGHPGHPADLARRRLRPLLGRADRRRPLPDQGLRGARSWSRAVARGDRRRPTRRAAAARRCVPDPVELGDDDVLRAHRPTCSTASCSRRRSRPRSPRSRPTCIGFEETVAAVLERARPGRRLRPGRRAACSTTGSTYVTRRAGTSHQQYAEFFAAIAEAAGQVTGAARRRARPGRRGSPTRRAARRRGRGPHGDVPVDAAARRAAASSAARACPARPRTPSARRR